jgi:guanine nucleotide-binding protein subunit alpha
MTTECCALGGHGGDATLIVPSYFDAIKRIAEPTYMPTDQDILRARVKTTGITWVQLTNLTPHHFDLPESGPVETWTAPAKLTLTSRRETHFRIGELTYKLFDVGGQRSERRKWLNIFDSVTALVFLIAISVCE